jgi:hypothetical protein
MRRTDIRRSRNRIPSNRLQEDGLEFFDYSPHYKQEGIVMPMAS